MNKICVLGASGFVGRALIERLLSNNDYEIVAAIHSPGNAWPILRFNISIVLTDLSDINSIDQAVKGCDYVVNLSLGEFKKMETQLSNLINVCKRNNIKRLIHISSITVYGDNPHPNSKFETGPALAKRGSYGWHKKKQDSLIKKANKKGLSAITLCPPHITGAYGRIFHQVIESIKDETFVLVENGDFPCNLVDVNNLCNAIELSIHAESTDGDRIFITNGDNYTWKDLAFEASILAGKDFEKIPRISKEDALKIDDQLSLINLLKRAFNNKEFKNDLGKTFLVRNQIIFNILKKLNSLKKSNVITKHTLITKNLNNINISLCKQQLRGVRHQIDRARSVIGYIPIVNSFESLKIFENYYKTLYGYNSEYWELIDR